MRTNTKRKERKKEKSQDLSLLLLCQKGEKCFNKHSTPCGEKGKKERDEKKNKRLT